MLQEDIVNVLEDKYEINIKKIEKNEESTDGNVYIVECTHSKYVLKLYNSEKHTVAMVELHNLLENNKINAPRIICDKKGDRFVYHKGEYFVLYSFIEGKKLKEVTFNKKEIKQVAKALRRLHSLGIEINGIDKISLSEKNDRNTLLHFDITKNNIFICNDEIYFIDFDDAKFGPAVYDVAIAVTNLFISKSNGANIDGIKYFIDEYYHESDILKNKELSQIKEASNTWLRSTLKNEILSTSIKEGLENKLYWIDKIWREQWIN